MDILDYLILEILAESYPFGVTIKSLSSRMGIPVGITRFKVDDRIETLRLLGLVDLAEDRFYFISEKGLIQMNKKGDR